MDDGVDKLELTITQTVDRTVYEIWGGGSSKMGKVYIGEESEVSENRR